MGRDSYIERRALVRGMIDVLAEPLQGAARDRFIDSAEATLRRSYPPASREQMRTYLKSNPSD